MKRGKIKGMKITLLGKIPKGDTAREGFVEWYQEYAREIAAQVPEAVFLHGDLIRDKEGSMKVVGHDLWLVQHADIVVVDAQAKIGAGTAQEMVMAKYFKKPLIAVIPKDTHHRRSNVIFDGVNIEDWVHPFLDVSADYVAESIEDAAAWIRQYVDGAINQEIKDITVFTIAIDEFTSELPEVAKKYQEKGW